MSGLQDSLRSIPADFDPICLGEVDRRLIAVAEEHRVAIGLAIESGSRAWGFPSPDSDYDCRFFFVRGEDDYLSPWQKRDVIETPLVDDIDLNGWELGKALKLLLKGNAVVVEWLMSPIVYSGDGQFREDLIGFAHRFSSRLGTERHYLHLGERQRRTYFGDGKTVQLKKLFYALRPAAALRWLRLHPERALAPMHFPTLIKECDPPLGVLELSKELIRRKAQTRELGSAPLPRLIERFVDSEFALAREVLPSDPITISPEARRAAEEFFRASVRRLGNRLNSTPDAGAAKETE